MCLCLSVCVVMAETGHGEIDLNNDEKGAALDGRSHKPCRRAGGPQLRRQRISDIPTPTDYHCNFYIYTQDTTMSGHDKTRLAIRAARYKITDLIIEPFFSPSFLCG